MCTRLRGKVREWRCLGRSGLGLWGGELRPKLVDVQGNINANGDASLMTIPLPVGLAAGKHALTASYSGSDALNPSKAQSP